MKRVEEGMFQKLLSRLPLLGQPLKHTRRKVQEQLLLAARQFSHRVRQAPPAPLVD